MYIQFTLTEFSMIVSVCGSKTGMLSAGYLPENPNGELGVGFSQCTFSGLGFLPPPSWIHLWDLDIYIVFYIQCPARLAIVRKCSVMGPEYIHYRVRYLWDVDIYIIKFVVYYKEFYIQSSSLAIVRGNVQEFVQWNRSVMFFMYSSRSIVWDRFYRRRPETSSHL